MTGGYFRSVAIDYDGTLTETPRPKQDVLETVQEARRSGWKAFLVTGRIFSELRADFPDVETYFDAIVAENGGVLVSAGSPLKRLAQPVSHELEANLRARGVSMRRGEVLLAGSTANDAIIMDEIGRLGLECHIVRNRSELMILPSGVSKGAGSVAAHAEFGLSNHNSVGIGDAENDHSLLDTAEVGVATGNAIDALKAHADVILEKPNGEGIRRFFKSRLLPQSLPVTLDRRSVELGTCEAHGGALRIPSARINVLITGESGVGKSYLAGLLAERLLFLGYTFCVLDFEGDHTELGQLRGVVTLGGEQPLPAVSQLLSLLRQGFGSIVLDLSLQDEATKRAYALQAVGALKTLRDETGLPHWIIAEEAHVLEADGGEAIAGCMAQTGVCRVSYLPQCLTAVNDGTVVLRLTARGGIRIGTRSEAPDSHFIPGARVTPHVRHRHKYAEGQLPELSRFVFRSFAGPTGSVAGNLHEFVGQVRHSDPKVVVHHVQNGDFSRWVDDVFHNAPVAAQIREIEARLTSDSAVDEVESVRFAIISALEQGYDCPV